jgi:hypothetical protein
MRLKEEAKSIEPDYVLRTSFAEILTALEIEPNQSSGQAFSSVSK